MHTLLNTFGSIIEVSHEKSKNKIIKCSCAVLYKAYRQIHVSEAQPGCIPSKD